MGRGGKREVGEVGGGGGREIKVITSLPWGVHPIAYGWRLWVHMYASHMYLHTPTPQATT